MNLNFAARIINELFNAVETLEKSRISPKFFTRKRKMTFVDVLYFMLNPARGCLQVRLNQFIEFAKTPFDRISEQALSKARAHFDHTPFEQAARALVLTEYSGDFPLPTIGGYHILAVDGSKVPLAIVEE